MVQDHQAGDVHWPCDLLAAARELGRAQESVRIKRPEYVFATAGAGLGDVVADSLAAALPALKPEQP